MLAKVKSLTLEGINCKEVLVEVDVANGLPAFDLVGLPAAAVREARERVRSALKNSGFDFPLQRITINLAPGDLRKEGTGLDLPIALGILASTGQLNSGVNKLAEHRFLGELALDGGLRSIPGALAYAWSMGRQELGKSLVLSAVNALEAAQQKNVQIYGLTSLRELVDWLSGSSVVLPLDYSAVNVHNEESRAPDLAHIKGQAGAKRALEVAAAGGHNLLMTGPPGSGKTMLARCLPSLIPPLTEQEALEATMLYSIANRLPTGCPVLTSRPFRAPHHGTTIPALIGGGRPIQLGELSLAHHGVLFLDELPEFSRSVLESLRQPLEDGYVSLARMGENIQYPCRVMVVAAMNPCPCGFLGDKEQECRCAPHALKRYLGRISGPLLDRMDLQITVIRPDYRELTSETITETSSYVRERVINARQLQRQRFVKNGFEQVYSNSQMTPEMVQRFCVIESAGEKFLQTAFKRLHMSARAYHRILKVARTLADLHERPVIGIEEIAEAIQHRGSFHEITLTNSI